MIKRIAIDKLREMDGREECIFITMRLRLSVSMLDIHMPPQTHCKPFA